MPFQFKRSSLNLLSTFDSATLIKGKSEEVDVTKEPEEDTSSRDRSPWLPSVLLPVIHKAFVRDLGFAFLRIDRVVLWVSTAMTCLT